MSGFFEFFIDVTEIVAASTEGAFIGGGFGDGFVELRLDASATDKGDKAFDFFIGDESSLDAFGLGNIWGNIKHVAFAEQFFGAGSIDDNARIDHRGHLKSDTSWNISFDQTS